MQENKRRYLEEPWYKHLVGSSLTSNDGRNFNLHIPKFNHFFFFGVILLERTDSFFITIESYNFILLCCVIWFVIYS